MKTRICIYLRYLFPPRPTRAHDSRSPPRALSHGCQPHRTDRPQPSMMLSLTPQASGLSLTLSQGHSLTSGPDCRQQTPPHTQTHQLRATRGNPVSVTRAPLALRSRDVAARRSLRAAARSPGSPSARRPTGRTRGADTRESRSLADPIHIQRSRALLARSRRFVDIELRFAFYCVRVSHASRACQVACTDMSDAERELFSLSARSAGFPPVHVISLIHISLGDFYTKKCQTVSYGLGSAGFHTVGRACQNGRLGCVSHAGFICEMTLWRDGWYGTSSAADRGPWAPAGWQ